jgi:hypothetical protein
MERISTEVQTDMQYTKIASLPSYFLLRTNYLSASSFIPAAL